MGISGVLSFTALVIGAVTLLTRWPSVPGVGVALVAISLPVRISIFFERAEVDTAGIAFAGVFFRFRYDWDQVAVVERGKWEVLEGINGSVVIVRLKGGRREQMRCVSPSMLSGKSAIDDFVAAAEGFRSTAVSGARLRTS